MGGFAEHAPRLVGCHFFFFFLWLLGEVSTLGTWRKAVKNRAFNLSDIKQLLQCYKPAVSSCYEVTRRVSRCSKFTSLCTRWTATARPLRVPPANSAKLTWKPFLPLTYSLNMPSYVLSKVVFCIRIHTTNSILQSVL